jgi:two-component system response regulator AtoC
VKPRILLVDDEPNMRRSLRLLLADLEIELVDAEDGPAALEVLAEQEIHLVVTDLRMPGMDGLELLHRVRDRRPEVPVVILTAFGSIESAVDAIREGAFDYVTKPFREEELKLVIERALAVGTVLHENRLLRDEIVGRYDFSRIIGTSPAIVESLRLAGEVASADTTVLLHGESGTGKELFARAIHYNSSRRSGPFVAVNCAAIPDALLESELFGHERGAFTGADRRKPGRFEAADGGTLFLDEIGDMSAAVQAKWLRVLEDRSFQRLGGNERIEVDVRIVCATNHSLRDAVREGSFREDLFYRVTAYPVRLPPLRERRQDILPIARAVLAELAPAMGKRIRDFDDGARARLEEHPWPGNVRELRNAVERAVILARGDRLEARDLFPDEERPAPATGAPSEDRAEGRLLDLPEKGLRLEELERDLIEQALARADGNVTRAGRLLGLSRATLRYRVRKFGLGRA